MIPRRPHAHSLSTGGGRADAGPRVRTIRQSGLPSYYSFTAVVPGACVPHRPHKGWLKAAWVRGWWLLNSFPEFGDDCCTARLMVLESCCSFPVFPFSSSSAFHADVGAGPPGCNDRGNKQHVPGFHSHFTVTRTAEFST
jgi:hypothetical protein